MKNAKRNVIVSAILTIALCFSLMIGGTYAWFTDSAKVNVNKIVSGSLKVGLEMKDGENWVDANGKTLKFINLDENCEDGDLWAPGYSFRLPELRVVNNGNLTLKFKAYFSGANGDMKLLDVIEFNVKVDNGVETAIHGASTICNNVKLYSKSENAEKPYYSVINITGTMDENAGNEYMNLSLDSMAITVVATQINASEADYPSIEMKSISGGTATIDAPITAGGYDGVIYAENGADVTINADINAVEQDRYAMAVWADGAGTKVTIKGGMFTQLITGKDGKYDDQYDMVYASNGAEIFITGGTFQIGKGNPKWTLNCNDKTKGKITVTGGTFFNYNPVTDCQEGEVIVPEGYYVVSKTEGKDVWYSVVSLEKLLAMDKAELASVLYVTEGDVTIDATDRTVTNTIDLWDDDTNDWSLVSVRETAKVTIMGGNFKAKADDCYAADVYDKDAKLVIKDGNFIGNVSAVYVFEGELVIEGGFFDIQQLNTNGVQDAYGVLINCYDANFKNGSAKVTITGGTFVNFNPADNKAEGAGTNFVPAGYHVESEDKGNGIVWYTVVKD